VPIELYLSNTQLREMVDARMHVGAHGAAHYWLDSLDRDAQIADIDASRSFLDGLGVAPHDFSFCYPYGAYNVTTLELLRARACRFALTTKPDIAQLKLADSLTLPRLDTNDLPKSARAHPNDWTLRATSM
jgi:peptidoglycan/xylan/chitin deacetylase (PgdA/CDA1 family)